MNKQLEWSSLRVAAIACLVGGLVGCNNSEDRNFIDDGKGSENFVANIISPPDDVDDRFQPVQPPVVWGTTDVEPDPTVISGYQEYRLNRDLMVTRGELNHTLGSAIMSMDFVPGQGIELLPVERSTGQLSMERTTDSVNYQIDQGTNIVGAVNGDFYNMYNGWNLGVVTIDGVNYTGWEVDREAVIVTKQNGSIEIWEQSPSFELIWGVNDNRAGVVSKVHYFDREHHENRTYTSPLFPGYSQLPEGNEIPHVEIYPGDIYRGSIDLKGLSAALVKPKANGVTVVDNKDGSTQVHFAPLEGKVTSLIQDSRDYVVPSGHALVVMKTEQQLLNVGDTFSSKYITDDPRWHDVKHAMGAGSRAHLLVKDGELSAGATDQELVSSRTAFGIRADGSGFFLVVDKPVGSPSDGVTLKKLGQIMRGYGAVDAVNLDGGGSSTMTAKMPGEKYNHVINVPADGVERVVANKLALYLDPDQANYDDAVAVFPREMTILTGSIYRRFKAIGFDGNTHENTNAAQEFGMSTADIGLIDVRTGAFKAGQNNAEGYVVVNVGEEQGVAKVTVVDSVDEMLFERAEMTINGGDSVAVLPTLLKDGSSITYDPEQLTYSLDTTNNGHIDSKTGIFYARDVQGQQTVVTVSYGEHTSSTVIQIGVPPVIVEDFENGTHFTASGARHKEVTVELVTDPVFDGDYALELAWEADPAQPGTFGAYVVDAQQHTELPGYPKALGVNVYIPEELAGKVWWVRGQLRDADGVAIGLNYNEEGDALPNRGWNFMRAEIPEGHRPPLKFDQPFRFLVLQTAERIDSQVVLDNFTAIYSDDSDLAGPTVNVTPADGETVGTKDVTIRMQTFDISGVDFNSIELSLNGEDVSHMVETNNQDAFWFDANGLDDGWHRVDYRVFDVHGNVTAGDTLFNVVTGDSRIFVNSNHDIIYPQGTFDLPLDVINGEKFSEFNLRISYDSTKSQLEMLDEDLTATNVSEGPGYWHGTFKGFSEATYTIAQMRLTVEEYVQNSAVSLVLEGELDGEAFHYPVLKQDIGGKYIVISDHAIQGQDNRILITDHNGTPTANVSVEQVIYNTANDEVEETFFLGRTNADGVLMYSPEEEDGSKEILFRAYDDEGSSLMSKLMSLSEQLTKQPRHVFIMPGRDSSEINVTWFTDSQTDETQAFYGTDNRLSYRAVDTSSEILPFFYGEKAGVVRVHHATLTGLLPGTEYSYQVGHSGAMSEVFTFKTDNQDDEVRILLYGDTQTTPDYNPNHGAPLVTELFEKMAAQLPTPDLIMHVGDITEDGSDYQLVRQFFEAIEGQGRMASTLFVPTIGNHEVYNEGRYKYESIYKSPANGPFEAPNAQSVYSFDYGNARIAVLNTELFTDVEWQVMTEWLVADMQASSQQWKIVMLHRPAYEGNPDSGNGFSKAYLPQAVDRAGVDLVLSGHDHMYSRSVPMANGRPNANGATYLIAGSASMKFYNAGFGGIVPFADVLYDDDVHTFTTLHIKGDQLEVETKNINGALIDRHVLTSRQ